MLNNIFYLPRIGLNDIIEIILLTLVVFNIANTLKGTRAWILLKGTLIMLIVYVLAYILQFNIIVLLFQHSILFLGIILIMALQPEIRRAIEQIGTNSLNLPIAKIISLLYRNRNKETFLDKISDKTIQELVKGCFAMSKVKTGVLIVIENNIPLIEYIDTGISINADITSQLLINIFEHNTPLHDGAVIIKDNRIISATCYLPLSENKEINKDLGTRHRAAIGITEVTDAFVIVVSEETGYISVARDGKLIHNINREQLTEELQNLQLRYRTKIDINKDKFNSFISSIPLKLVCLAATICLWFVLISVVNPVTTRTINNIPIQVINEDSINEIGKTYSLSENTVNVSITGRKSEIDSIKSSDILVTADINNLSIVNSISLETDITNSVTLQNIKLSKDTVTLTIDDLITKEFSIDVKQIKPPSDKYYISNIDCEPETVKVTGAKGIINKIGNVSIELDASEITSNTTLELEPIIYDKNGEELSTDNLEVGIKNVKVNIELYNTKLVPLKINVDTEDSLDGIIKNTSCDLEQVYIAGTPEILNKFNTIDLNLSINLDKDVIKNAEYVKNIDLSKYLPDGIYIPDKYSKVNVTVEFNSLYAKEITFKTSDVVINLGDNLKVDDKEHTIQIMSTNEQILNTSPIINLDLNGLDIGTYNIKANISNIDNSIMENSIIFEDTIEVNISSLY